MRLKYRTVTVSLLALLPTCAFAQEAGSVSPTQEAAGDTGLADIVVTAQRKVETAQKTALAIDVVSTQDLTNAGVNNPANLNAVAPSLNVTQGGGATASYFVRGVGNFTNNAYSDPAIAFNYDGVYIGRPTATGGAFFDLERIEVLKGPQGTLYGRNATGGAINVLPAKPRLGETSGSASLGYGNYNTVEAEAAINLPIGESTAIRAAGRVASGDGFNDDGTSNTRSQALRVQVLTEPSETLTLRLAGDYSHSGGKGVGSSFDGVMRFSPGTPASATTPANYTFVPSGLDARSGLTSPDAQAYFSRQVIGGSFINPAPLATPFVDDINWGVQGEANLKTALGTFTLLTAYRASSLDDLFNGPAFRGGRVDEDSHQFSSELRFAGERIGPVDWLVGAYYFNETVQGRSVFNQYIATSVQQYDVRTKSIAGFGRLTYNFSEKIRLVAAGRYTNDKKRLEGSAPTLINLCTQAAPPTGPGCFGGPSVPVGLSLADIAAAIPASLLPAGFPTAPGPANARPFGSSGNILFYTPIVVNDGFTKNRFTYRLALEADVGRSSLAYASYETGYRSGGFSLALGKETFRPEYIKAATIGVKNRFFNNRLQLNIEAFHWRYSDQQVSHFGIDALGLSSFFTENIGKSTIKGVDIDVQLKATPTTLFSGSVQYLDNKLKEFSYDTPRLATSLPPAVGCPFVPAVNSAGQNIYTVNCAGKPGFNSPKWAFNLGVQQDIPVGDYRVRLNADGRYRSNRVIGFDYLAQQNSGSTFQADASIAFGPDSENWSITGWVRNLTNKDVPVLTQYNASIAGTISTTYAPPRTYGVRATAKF